MLMEWNDLFFEHNNPPSALLTASLGVNDVQSRLAGEIFQVLFNVW
jgi:hypothetical protein